MVVVYIVWRVVWSKTQAIQKPGQTTLWCGLIIICWWKFAIDFKLHFGD